MLKKLYFSCKHSDLHEAEVDYLLYDYAWDTLVISLNPDGNRRYIFPFLIMFYQL